MRDIANNQSNQKPNYKDYQSFLQNYGSGGKPNGASISPASSCSSLQSTENDISVPKTYNEFLQSYGTRKFGSVRMKNSVKNNVREGADEADTKLTTDGNNKKLVRSELVINIRAPEDQHNSPESYLKLAPVTSSKVEDNRKSFAVSDDMIHAKSAVLEELLSNSPSLRKPPPGQFKTGNTKSIYHKLEQFTSDKKEKNLPPPLPATKPLIFRRNSLKSPISPKPPVPQKTFLKSDDHKKNNHYKEHLKEDLLIRELQHMMGQNHQEADKDKILNIPPPPKVVQQQLQAKNSYQNNIPNMTTVVPVSDPNVDVDKNDPNVKKLVYNTYRGMLGAYNNRANNMVSTLPRNFVVQDRGVTKQVESITSQGCLAHLNGRINPNPED